ncbi:MAG: hypothetical protein VX246_04490 [Myxococcota bacterium]|nr:hypothetical protein [Myxococcota bacterium]
MDLPVTVVFIVAKDVVDTVGGAYTEITVVGGGPAVNHGGNIVHQTGVTEAARDSASYVGAALDS